MVGLLFGGKMSPSLVKAILEKIELEHCSDEQLIEFVFHPGGAVAGEEGIWKHYPAYRNYYFSRRRRFESESIRSAELRLCLKRFSESTTKGGKV